MKNLKYYLGPMRLPFLVLAPVCVLAGIASAALLPGGLSALFIILSVIAGVAAHISVNALNEYSDFKTGLDFKTQRTPFSGGSGTLPANPEKSHIALTVGLGGMLVTVLIGVYFILVGRDLRLLWMGLLGVLVILAYTPWLNRRVLLCLIAPGLGFGTCMVLSTDFVLRGNYSWAGFFASLVPFFLVSNLLLLNQFPDVEADRSVGRKNVVIVYGKKVGAVVYTSFLALAYLSIVAGVVFGFLPAWSLLGLGSLIVAVPMLKGIFRNMNDTGKLIPSMGMNVIVTLLTPLLMAVGMFIGR
jgi:1,4-dihydroxy-2-naphthoate polyprenyltransferase